MKRDKIRQEAAQIAAENKATLDAFRIACCSLFVIQTQSKTQLFTRKPSIGLRFRLGTSMLVITAPKFDYRTKTVLVDKQTVELIEQQETEEQGEKFFRPVKRLTLSLSETGNSVGRFYPKRLQQDASQLLEGMKLFLYSPRQMLENSFRCAVCGRVLADGLSRARGVGPECIETVSRWPLYTSCSVFNPVVPVQRELPLEL